MRAAHDDVVKEYQRIRTFLVGEDGLARAQDAAVSDNRLLTSIFHEGNAGVFTLRTIQTNGKRYKYTIQEDTD